MIGFLLFTCTLDAPSDADRSDGTGVEGSGGETLAPTYGEAPWFEHRKFQINDRVGSIIEVSWQQNVTAEVYVGYAFDGGGWLASPTKHRIAGLQSEILLGVPFGQEVTWRLHGTDGTTTVRSVDALATNDPLPSGTPSSVVHVYDPDGFDLSGAPYFLVGLPEIGHSWTDYPWWVIIIDRWGRPVWARKTPNERSSMHSRVARDGQSLFIDRNSFWPMFDGGRASTVDRVLIDGSLLHTYQTPGLHHAFVDLPDGSLAYSANVGVEEITIVHSDGSAEFVWTCAEFVASLGLDDTCGANTVTYDEPTNMFLVSDFEWDTVFEVDRTLGVVSRWWGGAASPWLVDPPLSTFANPHGAYLTTRNTIMASTDREGPDGLTEMVVREYRVDDAAMTLHDIGSWGVGDGIDGVIMGSALRLPNGNVIQNTGGVARLREYAPDGTVVWDVEWPNDAIGSSTPIADLYALAP